MNVKPEIERIKQTIRENVKCLLWLQRNQGKLADLAEGAMYNGQQIDFNNVTHQDTVKIIRTLGGKWKKAPSSMPSKVDYETEMDGLKLRVWAGDPPPSCQIVVVEELVPEVVVPAHVRKVNKMICKKGLGEIVTMLSKPV